MGNLKERVQKAVNSEGSIVNKEYNYQYDYENRLVKVIFPDNSYENYLYAPNGKRVAVQKWKAGASEPEETTYFVYDALQCNNVYEFSTSTTTINRYIYNWPGNEMISKITAYPPDGVSSLSYYHYDGIGSASAITDANGTVTNTYRYDPFGNIITSTGKIGRYSFVGAFGVENDGMSGLFHMGARYYDPTIGRFIQRNPVRGFVSDPLSLNRYIYCGNNPINFIDPKGLECKTFSDYFWNEFLRIENVEGMYKIAAGGGGIALGGAVTTIFGPTVVTPVIVVSGVGFMFIGIPLNIGHSLAYAKDMMESKAEYTVSNDGEVTFRPGRQQAELEAARDKDYEEEYGL